MSGILISGATSQALSSLRRAVTDERTATLDRSRFEQRPSFRDDALSAGIVSNGQSRRLEMLHKVEALRRDQTLLDVTLTSIGSIRDVLTEMQDVSMRLHEGKFDADTERTLAEQYNDLATRIDQIAEAATFNGRNLIGGFLEGSGGGDLTLADGTVFEATDLRRASEALSVLEQPGGSEINAPLSENLVSAFGFDEGAGGGASSHDWTVDNGQATLINGGSWTAGRDINDGAVDLSGGAGRTSGEHLQISNVEIGNKLTFAMTVKFDDLSSGQDTMLFGARETNNNANRMVMRVNESGQAFATYSVDNVNYTRGFRTQLQEDQWYHLMFTTDESGQFTTYLNGSKITTTAAEPIADVVYDEIWIGAGVVADGQPTLDGQVSDVVFYDRGVSDVEAQSIYEASLGGVENWSPDGSAATWGQVSAEIQLSIDRLLNVEVGYARASRSIDHAISAQENLAQTLEASIARQIEFEPSKVSARQASASVAKQLAIASLEIQSQTNGSQLSLFSNALRNQKSLFDAWQSSQFNGRFVA